MTRFCAAEGVSLASYYLWRKKLAAEKREAQPRPTAGEGQAFSPVTLVGASTLVVELPGGTRFAVTSHPGNPHARRNHRLCCSPTFPRWHPPCVGARPTPSATLARVLRDGMSLMRAQMHRFPGVIVCEAVLRGRRPRVCGGGAGSKRPRPETTAFGKLRRVRRPTQGKGTPDRQRLLVPHGQRPSFCQAITIASP